MPPWFTGRRPKSSLLSKRPLRDISERSTFPKRFAPVEERFGIRRGGEFESQARKARRVRVLATIAVTVPTPA